MAKGIRFVVGIVLALVAGLAFGWSVSPSPVSAASVTSWNPNVFCEGNQVTIPFILGSAYPAQSLSGSPYQTGDTTGGVPHPRALIPPCTITNVNGVTVGTFVEIDRVYLADLVYQPFDCDNQFARVNGGGPYPNNETICEWQGTLFEMGTTEGFLQIEFEKDWLAKGYCGAGVWPCDNETLRQNVSGGTVSIDVQGFVFWDGENWELHPFTAWRPTPQPDIWMEASTTSMRIPLGHSESSALTLWSLNGFEGTLALTVSTEAVNVPPIPLTIYPSAWVDPAWVTLTSGGSGSSTLTVSASLLTTPGTYAVTVTATSGTISRSVTISVEIVLI
jgi:hypothetical protein